MNGLLLTCYVHESETHRHLPVWESLLQHANRIGIRGGSVFKSVAGFGRHHQVHENPPVLDLHGTQTLQLEFLITEAEAQTLLDWVKGEGIRLFYAVSPARFGNLEISDL